MNPSSPNTGDHRPFGAHTADTRRTAVQVTVLFGAMAMVYETNVDDMDPRLWPNVIDQLLAVGALDAWLTPIIMKKGRPAFTLSVLCEAESADIVRSTIFQETTTIGIRERAVDRHVLDRSKSNIDLDGQLIGVKTASDRGEIVNRSVEWDDVAKAAKALGLSAKDVLAAATAHAFDQTMTE